MAQSCIYITYICFRIFFIKDCYKIVNIVPCADTVLLKCKALYSAAFLISQCRTCRFPHFHVTRIRNLPLCSVAVPLNNPPRPEVTKLKIWGICDFCLPSASDLQSPAGSGSRLAPEHALTTIHLDLEPYGRHHIPTHLQVSTVFLPPFLILSTIQG